MEASNDTPVRLMEVTQKVDKNGNDYLRLDFEVADDSSPFVGEKLAVFYAPLPVCQMREDGKAYFPRAVREIAACEEIQDGAGLAEFQQLVGNIYNAKIRVKMKDETDPDTKEVVRHPRTGEVQQVEETFIDRIWDKG